MENTALREGARAHLDLRRSRILGVVARPLQVVGSRAEPLPTDRIEHLRREAEDLYWNELSWEQLTDEEMVGGGHLTEMVFSAFLAFIDGLLLEEVLTGSPTPARPHPDAVEAILHFLASRHQQLTAELADGADSERLVWGRAMTARLIDLVLCRLYRLAPEEWEELDRE